MTLNPGEQFRDTIRAAGLTPPEVIEPGRFHRFPGIGKNNGNKAGWCKLFPDGIGGTFGDHAAGVHESWQASREKPMTPAERAAFAEQVKQAREEADARRREIHTAAAERAARIYADLKPAPVDHPYLASKGMRPHCARIDLDGRLVVPVYSGDGTDRLQSLQFIAHDGEKRFLPDGKMAGGWCLIGTPEAGAPLLLCEGFATGASLHEATGRAVVVAFTAGNLLDVAKMMRTRWPESSLLICGDDDTRTEGNPGRSKAEAAAIATDARVVFPSFSGSAAGTDFNDVAAASGLDEVRRQVEAIAPANIGAAGFRVADWGAERFTGKPEQRAWLVNGIFPAGRVSLLAAAGGIGKSYSLLELVRRVAMGNVDPFNRPRSFGGMVESFGAAVLITAEDDSIEIHGRLASMGDLPQRLFVVPLPDAGGARPLFEAGRDGVTHATPAWHDLAKQLHAVPDLRLIVLDPLQPLCAVDLNDASPAQFICSTLGALAADTGAAVIVSHHFAKNRDLRGPAEAREAVRGSGALVDGVRACYALWPASERDGRDACAVIGQEWQPDSVIRGAVVKANGKAFRGVATFIRNEFGLLVDQSAILKNARPEESDLLPLLEKAIADAAAQGKPYTKRGLNGLYERRAELPEALQGLSKNRAPEIIDTMLMSGQLVQVAINAGVVKWLDVPFGEVAAGRIKLESGYVRSATGGRKPNPDASQEDTRNAG